MSIVGRTAGSPGREANEPSRKPLTALQRTLFLISLPLGLLGFVLPIYGHEIGASAIQIGLFLSAFSLARVVIRPLVGLGVYRYGRKPFLLGGLLGYALSMFAFAFSDGLWGLVIARVLQGVGAACLWLVVDTVVADVSPKDTRGHTFGRLRQAGVQGQMVGTFVGLNVLFSLEMDSAWQPVFFGFGVSGLAAVLLAWLSVPETRTAAPETVQGIIAWSRIWGILLLVSFVTSMSWSLVAPTVTIFLQEMLDVGLVELTIAYLPAGAVMAFLPGRLGLLADYYGRKPLMMIGIAVAACSSFVIPNLASTWGLAALRAIQALSFVASGPAQRALVADLIGNARRGRAYGFYALAGGLGQVAGPVLGGWLYDAISPAVPFYVNGIVLTLCAIAVGMWLQVPLVRE